MQAKSVIQSVLSIPCEQIICGNRAILNSEHHSQNGCGD